MLLGDLLSPRLGQVHSAAPFNPVKGIVYNGVGASKTLRQPLKVAAPGCKVFVQRRGLLKALDLDWVATQTKICIFSGDCCGTRDTLIQTQNVGTSTPSAHLSHVVGETRVVARDHHSSCLVHRYLPCKRRTTAGGGAPPRDTDDSPFRTPPPPPPKREPWWIVTPNSKQTPTKHKDENEGEDMWCASLSAE